MAAGRPAPEPEFESGTLDDFAATYFRAKAPVLSSETIRNREDDYRLRIGPKLGHHDLADLTRERVEVWLAGLVASASSRRMVVQSVATLRVILATAVEWGRLAENPAAKLTIPAHETNAEQASSGSSTRPTWPGSSKRRARSGRRRCFGRLATRGSGAAR